MLRADLVPTSHDAALELLFIPRICCTKVTDGQEVPGVPDTVS